MELKLNSNFQESLDKLDLDSLLLLISILSQKALFLQQTKDLPPPSPIIIAKEPKLII